MKRHALRDGLLPKAVPWTTCRTLLAGVVGDGRLVFSTSSGIPPFSFSWELEGPIASLLGTGVTFPVVVFLKDGFLTEAAGLAIELTPFGSLLAFQTPEVELGVELGALEKKLRIEPFFVDPALEVCFLRDEGAGVTSDPSFLAMMVARGKLTINSIRDIVGKTQVAAKQTSTRV